MTMSRRGLPGLLSAAPVAVPVAAAAALAGPAPDAGTILNDRIETNGQALTYAKCVLTVPNLHLEADGTVTKTFDVDRVLFARAHRDLKSRGFI